jgi:hypothetical protein
MVARSALETNSVVTVHNSAVLGAGQTDIVGKDKTLLAAKAGRRVCGTV